MNPITKNTPQNQTLANMLQFLNNGGNPQQMISMLMQRNPNARGMIEQLKKMSNGQSPKDFAMNMARQQGIDPDQVMQVANKMGLK